MQAHWFASVHYLVFDQGDIHQQQPQCDLCETAVRSSRFAPGKRTRGAAAARCICTRIGSEAHSKLTVHTSIAPAMRRAVQDATLVDGRIIVSLLFMHFDLLLNVRRFHSARFDAFWTLRAGLTPKHVDPCCYALSSPAQSTNFTEALTAPGRAHLLRMPRPGVLAPQRFSAALML